MKRYYTYFAVSRARVTFYWIFKKLRLYWTTVDYKFNISVPESRVGSLYNSSMNLINIRNYIYPGRLE